MNHSPRERANAAVGHFLSGRDWSAQTPARQRILAAFLSLATAKGFNSVTMRTLGHQLDMKAPSLYSSFPGGKDEIVAESLSWFTHRFAHDLLNAVEVTATPEEYWEALVHSHLAQQLQRQEADLLNLLVATDQVARVLGDDVRQEVAEWTKLYEDMYAAAAEEMGLPLSRRSIHVIFTLLDGARRWAGWDGSDQDLELILGHAVLLTRSILEISSGAQART